MQPAELLTLLPQRQGTLHLHRPTSQLLALRRQADQGVKVVLQKLLAVAQRSEMGDAPRPVGFPSYALSSLHQAQQQAQQAAQDFSILQEQWYQVAVQLSSTPTPEDTAPVVPTSQDLYSALYWREVTAQEQQREVHILTQAQVQGQQHLLEAEQAALIALQRTAVYQSHHTEFQTVAIQVEYLQLELIRLQTRLVECEIRFAQTVVRNQGSSQPYRLLALQLRQEKGTTEANLLQQRQEAQRLEQLLYHWQQQVQAPFQLARQQWESWFGLWHCALRHQFAALCQARQQLLETLQKRQQSYLAQHFADIQSTDELQTKPQPILLRWYGPVISLKYHRFSHEHFLTEFGNGEVTHLITQRQTQSALGPEQWCNHAHSANSGAKHTPRLTNQRTATQAQLQQTPRWHPKRLYLHHQKRQTDKRLALASAVQVRYERHLALLPYLEQLLPYFAYLNHQQVTYTIPTLRPVSFNKSNDQAVSSLLTEGLYWLQHEKKNTPLWHPRHWQLSQRIQQTMGWLAAVANNETDVLVQIADGWDRLDLVTPVELAHGIEESLAHLETIVQTDGGKLVGTEYQLRTLEAYHAACYVAAEVSEQVQRYREQRLKGLLAFDPEIIDWERRLRSLGVTLPHQPYLPLLLPQISYLNWQAVRDTLHSTLGTPLAPAELEQHALTTPEDRQRYYQAALAVNHPVSSTLAGQIPSPTHFSSPARKLLQTIQRFSQVDIQTENKLLYLVIGNAGIREHSEQLRRFLLQVILPYLIAHS